MVAAERGDMGAIDELVHPDHRDHAPEGGSAGREGVRRSMEWLGATFGDPRNDVEDLIAAGDRVVARVRFSATHIGELEGIPPTGRRFQTEHVHIWRVADGLLAEHWMVRDDLAVVRQLGALETVT